MSSARDAANRVHLSTRVASSRFDAFVCAAGSVHAIVVHPRAHRISPAHDGACLTRIGTREMLRMCNATPKPANTSESGPFVSCENGVRSARRTVSHTTHDTRRSAMPGCADNAARQVGPPRSPRDVFECVRSLLRGRMRRAHADSSVNQNTPPARLPHSPAALAPLSRGACRQMAHALLNVRQVRPEALARQQTDGDTKATKPGGDATRPSGATDNRPLCDERVTTFH